MAAPAIEGVAVTALRSVMFRVRQAAERAGRRPELVRVVAVSKTKPVSLIRQVYDAGHRCFGENYVQEIVDKAPQVSTHACTVQIPAFMHLILFVCMIKSSVCSCQMIQSGISLGICRATKLKLYWVFFYFCWFCFVSFSFFTPNLSKKRN